MMFPKPETVQDLGHFFPWHHAEEQEQYFEQAPLDF